jgi:hypothetical protein
MEVPFRVSDIIVDPETNIISKANTATLSAEAAALLTDIRIYPNPSTNGFFIESPLSLESVRLLDLQGRMLVNFKTDFERNQPAFFPTDQANGIYFVQIKTALGTLHKQLVVR